MKIILFGPPGAGKTSLAMHILREYNIPIISLSSLIKNEIMLQTDLGEICKPYFEQGLLIPDDIAIRLLEPKIIECGESFLLDGFPKTVSQANLLEKILIKINSKINLFLFIDISKDILLERISTRIVCPHCGFSYSRKDFENNKDIRCTACSSILEKRNDDNSILFENRLDYFYKSYSPLKEFYSNKNILRILDDNKEQNYCLINEYINELT